MLGEIKKCIPLTQNLKARTIKDSYFILLAIYNCSLLMSLAAGFWKYKLTIAFILVMIALQFLSKKFWFTTFLSFIPFYYVHIPLFPRLTNHGNLEVFIGFTFFLLLVSNFLKSKNQSLHHVQIKDIFIYTTATIYFIAGFHKLNSGFFDLNNGCTTIISSNFNNFMFGSDFKLSPVLIRMGQIFTIVFEMILPFGLLFKRTRKMTILLFVGFHFYMSLCNFSNFSALAGFLLCGCIIDFDNTKESNASIIKGLRIYIFFTLLSVLTSYAITRLGFLDKTYVRIYNGLIFNIGWVTFFFILLKNTTNKKRNSKFRFIPIAFVLFLFLWGIQPYLGLSNSGNLTMFSNLKTLQSQNNHYLVNTENTKIWNFEEDLVTIINIPDSLTWSHNGKLKNYQLPLIEFKSQAETWVNKYKNNIELTISHNGNIIHIPNLKASKYHKTKWWYHYIYFRRIPKRGINECLW